MTLSTRSPYNGSPLVATRGRLPVVGSGSRRVRVGGVALAMMLLALGAALSGIALMSVSHTRAYLAVARHVAAGTQITPDVLRTVNLPSAPGLAAMPATELDSVLGKYASVTLFPGSLLVADDVLPTTAAPGAYQVSVCLTPGGLPSPELKPGDKLLLYPRDSSNQTFTVTLLSVGAPEPDGTQLYVAVQSREESRAVALLNSTVGLTAALAPAGE